MDLLGTAVQAAYGLMMLKHGRHDESDLAKIRKGVALLKLLTLEEQQVQTYDDAEAYGAICQVLRSEETSDRSHTPKKNLQSMIEKGRDLGSRLDRVLQSPDKLNPGEISEYQVFFNELGFELSAI